MPTIMIHEEVGYYLSKELNISSYDFYLGLLAPDSPNLEGFAPKEERWQAHLRRYDYKEWRQALKEFYQKEKTNYPKDFLLGYIIHVLTDIIYDEFFYLKVREEIEKEYSRDDSHTIMRNDMSRYYFKEIEEITELLKNKNNSYDILNISKETLLKWKEKTISLFPKENTSIYQTKEIIQKLNQKVLEELKEGWL